MIELTASQERADNDTRQDEEVFDFSSPETVIFEVLAHDNADQSRPDWKFHSIEASTVIATANPFVTGAASYEVSYGGFLDYTIQDLVDCPGEGWWILEDVTGHYYKGDSRCTDDDMEFYCGKVRPATTQEIEKA